jgi:hypothetical protein
LSRASGECRLASCTAARAGWAGKVSISSHRRSGTTYGNGQVVASGELGDLADAPERGTHDNGLVVVLLVVVEDGLYALDTGVLLLGVLLLGRGLVPVENAADKGRDEEGASLGGGDGLDE